MVPERAGGWSPRHGPRAAAPTRLPPFLSEPIRSTRTVVFAVPRPQGLDSAEWISGTALIAKSIPAGTVVLGHGPPRCIAMIAAIRAPVFNGRVSRRRFRLGCPSGRLFARLCCETPVIGWDEPGDAVKQGSRVARSDREDRARSGRSVARRRRAARLALGLEVELVSRQPILLEAAQRDIVHAACSGYADRRLRAERMGHSPRGRDRPGPISRAGSTFWHSTDGRDCCWSSRSRRDSTTSASSSDNWPGTNDRRSTSPVDLVGRLRRVGGVAARARERRGRRRPGESNRRSRLRFRRPSRRRCRRSPQVANGPQGHGRGLALIDPAESTDATG